MSYGLLQDSAIVHPVPLRMSPDGQTYSLDSDGAIVAAASSATGKISFTYMYMYMYNDTAANHLLIRRFTSLRCHVYVIDGATDVAGDDHGHIASSELVEHQADSTSEPSLSTQPSTSLQARPRPTPKKVQSGVKPYGQYI